jgi:hypothetical protein
MPGLAKKHGRRYPWHVWFRSSGFVLRRGVDYACRTDTMAQMVRNAAVKSRYNKRVTISIHEDGSGLTVRVLGDGGARP